MDKKIRVKLNKRENKFTIDYSKVHDRNDTKTIFKKSRTYLPGVDHFDKHHVCVPVGWWLTDKDVEGIASLVLGYRRKYE